MQYEVNNLFEAASLILEKVSGHTLAAADGAGDETQGGSQIVPSDPTPVGGSTATVYNDFSYMMSDVPCRVIPDTGPYPCRIAHETAMMDFIATPSSGETRRSQLKCIPMDNDEFVESQIFDFPNDGASNEFSAEVWMSKVVNAGTAEEVREWVVMGTCEFVFESADSDALLTEFRMHVSADNPAGLPISEQHDLTRDGHRQFLLPTHMIFYINERICLVGHTGQGVFCDETPYYALTSDDGLENVFYSSSVCATSEYGIVPGEWDEIISELETNATKVPFTQWAANHPTSNYGIHCFKTQEGYNTVRYYVAGWYRSPQWDESKNCGFVFSIGEYYVDFGYVTTRHLSVGPC